MAEGQGRQRATQTPPTTPVTTGGAAQEQRPPAPARTTQPTAKISSVRPPESVDNAGWLSAQLRSVLFEGEREVRAVRRRLQISYWTLLGLTFVLLVVGLALVVFPALGYYRNTIDEIVFAALAGAGIVLISLLLYFRPLERAQILIADATYVSLIKDSFHYQVTLRLLALEGADHDSIARAADQVAEAAQASMDLVYAQVQARRSVGMG